MNLRQLSCPQTLLRTALEADSGLLREIYAGTRGDLMHVLPPEIARLMVDQQFDAQEAAWEAFYPGLERLVILNGNSQPAGRLYRQWRASGLWIVDLALLPGRRGTGLGISVLRQEKALAEAAGKPVRGHVMKSNAGPLRLFQKIGFQIVSDAGEYVEVCWE